VPDQHGSLYLYEALELRGEYDARIKDLRDLLPEGRKKESHWSRPAEEEEHSVPSPGVELAALRKELRALERKRIMLGSAIQETNYRNQVEVAGESMSIARALEERKALGQRIAELHELLIQSAYVKVIYKEGRDITTPPAASFPETREELARVRSEFRGLNRALRAVSFTTLVDFRDGP